ncbi:hypothetical protein GW17_00045254 [Ensete ventricosum]|nr:hypothetical protein GW17_00045254 [Ensete ventricosum]
MGKISCYERKKLRHSEDEVYNQEVENLALMAIEDEYGFRGIGNSPGVRRELAERIGSLLGWCKGVRRKKIETRRKIVEGSRKACREISKGAATVHSYGSDFLRAYPRRTIEPRGTKDKGRSPTSHAKAYWPLYCHPSPYTKKVDKRRTLRTINYGVVLALQRTVEPRTSLLKGPAPHD